RLLRQDLAQELTGDRAVQRVSPLLILQGAITRDEEAPDNDQETKPGPRAGRVTILGVNDSFWRLWPEGNSSLASSFWRSAEKEVVLNTALARELEVTAGSTVVLHLQKMSAVPRESLLGRKDASEVVDEVRVTVRAVLEDETPGSRFNLNPSPSTP